MKRICLLASVLATLIAAPSPARAQHIKLTASLGDLEKAAASDSNDAAAHYNVALGYWNAKRWNDVDSALHRAIRIDPEFAAAYVALSFLPYARRPSLADEENEHRVPAEWEPALQESDRLYRRAFMIDPLVELRLGDAVFPRSTMYLDALKRLYGEWLADFQDGLDQYYLGKYQAAYDRFQRVVNYFNGASHADRLTNSLLYWHGLAAAQVGKSDDAVWDFATILTRYTDAERKLKDSTLHVPLRTNEYRFILAFMKQRAGKFNEAIDLYREALQNDIGLYTAHVHLAQIYEDHNLMPQAIAERRAAVDANPDDACLLLDLGKSLAHANQWADAEKALLDAVATNPRDPRPHYLLGIVEQHENKAAAARAAFEDFIALAPSRYRPQVADAKQRVDALH
jgi:tetratricopeptide (TPR) repeat protein